MLYGTRVNTFSSRVIPTVHTVITPFTVPVQMAKRFASINQLFVKENLINSKTKLVVDKLPDSLLLKTPSNALADLVAMHNWYKTGLFAKTPPKRSGLVGLKEYTPATVKATFKAVAGKQIAKISNVQFCDGYISILNAIQSKM